MFGVASPGQRPSLSQLRKYDVLATFPVTGVSVTYECKRDRLAHKTGNVAVEHKAILHSEADFIVYLIDGKPDLYQIGRQTLIGLLKENWQGDRRWRVVQGGEFHDYMTLIPVKEFIALNVSI
jgi:hypothetical protein